MFIFYHIIFHTFAFAFAFFSLYFFQPFSTGLSRAGMGLGFNNCVILAISRDSHSRSEVCIGCVTIAYSDLFMKSHKGDFATVSELTDTRSDSFYSSIY